MMMPNSLLAHWQEPALVKDHLLLSDWHQLPQNWQPHKALALSRASLVNSTICFREQEIQEEPYHTNLLLHASPILMLTQHPDQNCTLSRVPEITSCNSSENRFRSIHFPENPPASKLCWSPHCFPSHLLFWQMQWRSWTLVVVLARWC